MTVVERARATLFISIALLPAAAYAQPAEPDQSPSAVTEHAPDAVTEQAPDAVAEHAAPAATEQVPSAVPEQVPPAAADGHGTTGSEQAVRDPDQQ